MQKKKRKIYWRNKKITISIEKKHIDNQDDNVIKIKGFYLGNSEYEKNNINIDSYLTEKKNLQIIFLMIIY